MSWRSRLSILATGILLGCGPVPPVAPTDARPPDPEPDIRVEVELLELPAAEEQLPVQELDRKRVERNAQDSDVEEGGDKTFFRGLIDGLKARLKDAKGGEATVAPPPPPHLEAPVETPAGEAHTIRQATGESVGGRVEPASIQDAVAKQRASFTRCLTTDSKLVLEATIAPSGDVIDARSTSSQPDDPKLRDCVVDAFKRLKLPALTTPTAARVKFALALKRSGDY